MHISLQVFQGIFTKEACPNFGRERDILKIPYITVSPAKNESNVVNKELVKKYIQFHILEIKASEHVHLHVYP